MVHPPRLRKWTWERGCRVRIQHRSQHTEWAGPPALPGILVKVRREPRSFK